MGGSWNSKDGYAEDDDDARVGRGRRARDRADDTQDSYQRGGNERSRRHEDEDRLDTARAEKAQVTGQDRSRSRRRSRRDQDDAEDDQEQDDWNESDRYKSGRRARHRQPDR